MNATEPLLNSDHPSFGTRNATFQFALEDLRTHAIVRFIIVEAANPYAVATLERILVQNEQRVAPNCRVLCVFRDSSNTGVRDDLVEEIPYIDFMTDIVEPGWLLADPVNTTCFSQSITPSERDRALTKARLLGQGPNAPVSTRRLALAPAPEETSEETEEVEETPEVDQRGQLCGALTGMGFKKSAVEKFVRDLGPRVNQDPLQDLLREGLRALAS